MKKLQDLREYLLSKIPDLSRNPDQILTFVENGKIKFSPGHWYGNYSHNYQMPARIIITDWRKPVDDIVLPLLEWMNVREPGFNPETAISFECEIIDKETVDISLTIEITERVIVKYADGKQSVEHVLPEPVLQMNPDASWQFNNKAPGEDYVIPDNNNG